MFSCYRVESIMSRDLILLGDTPFGHNYKQNFIFLDKLNN